MRIKPGDIVIVILALALALTLALLWPASGGSLTAVVTQDGRVLRRIVLTGLEKPLSFNIDGPYHNHIVAENNRIRFDASDCPDKTCVYTGWLTRAGQSAACLPNKAMIVIEGSGEVDAVAD